MAWKPPAELPAENPRLERYRRRVGRLRDRRGREALLLIEPEVYRTQIGGVLWWRRWSTPRYVAHLWMMVAWLEFPFTDSLVDADALEAELDRWEAGRFTFVGDVFAVEWLSVEESQQVAATEFGFPAPR